MNLIEVNNIVKRYKQFVALNQLSFEVRQGEILGLLGPNGCGKSTIMNCMLGLLKYDRGEIRVLRESTFPLSAQARRQIGIVPQELAYLEQLTVRENIDFFCGLYVTDKQTRRQYVADAIQFAGLEDFVNFLPRKLSGGLKRRLNIACGISHKPSLIFFDEPTVAVDTQSRNFILEGIQQLNEAGATIVYTTHYLEEVDQICDRIVIMDQGHQLVSGTSRELKDSVTIKEKVKITFLDTPTEEALAQLHQIPGVVLVETHKTDVTLHFDQAKGNLIRVAEVLEEKGMPVGNVESIRPTLDDVFLAYTGKGLRDIG